MAWVWPEDRANKSRNSPNRRSAPEVQTKLENPEKFPKGDDGRPRKSERQEYDFMHTNNLTTLTAPFGTTDTPNISYKIIGSKPVHVIESVQPHRVPDSTFYGGPRIHSIPGITEKPNEVNANLLNEGAKGYYTAQQGYRDFRRFQRFPESLEQLSHLQGKPTHSNPITDRGRRPSSKSLSPWKSLPPIEANRGKNTRSTVFEREPWVKNRDDTKLATNTEYKTHFETRPNSDRGPQLQNGFDYQVNGTGPPRAKTDYNGVSGDMNQSSLTSLINLLPPGHYLPSDPVNFDQRQREALLDVTSDDLRNTTTDDIKSVYQILSRFDRELSGWIPIEKVQDALRACKVEPSYDTLRCIAAMYVDPRYQGYVNYEEIVKFLNEAIKMSHAGKRRYFEELSEKYSDFSPEDTKNEPKYRPYETRETYEPYESYTYDRQDPFPLYKDHLPRIGERKTQKSPEVLNYDRQDPFPPPETRRQYYSHRAASPVRNISISREKETAMLLSRTAQQLGNHRIDMEKLIRSFQELDADRREMLAAAEIKNILYDNRIQLQESLVNDILTKMEGPNRDGKFSWKKFVEFLERVQPTKTGLEIYYNKRPLEYAKQYPQPVDSWPRAKETPRMSPPPAPYTKRSLSPSPRMDYGSQPPSRRDYELPPLSPRRDYGYSPPPPRRSYDYPRRSYDNGPRYKYPRPSEDIWRKIDAIEAEIKDLEESNQGREPLSSRAPGGENPEVRNRIMTIEDQIKELEHKNQYLRQGLDSDTRGDSWESKLIQLAGILYRMDEYKNKSTGRLYYDTIVEYTRNHNQYANMGIPDEVIVSVAQRHMNDRNMVDIERFIESLGDRRTWFRRK